jgi:hypothetical protein
VKVLLLGFVAAACGLAVLLASGGDDTESPAAVRVAAPEPPAAPGRYRLPRGAVRVSSPRGLHGALARHERRSIVLAPGRYESRRPFLNPHGHRLFGARRGRSVLRAGLSLGGNDGRGGGVARGLVIDVDDPRRTVEGAAIAVWGAGRDARILDTTLRGNGVMRSGISARTPDGLRIRRVVVRGFTDFGVLVDANDVDRGILEAPFRLEDVDVARIGRANAGSSEGRAEACVWIGNTGLVRRVRARDCAWAGVWTGTAANRVRVEHVDVDGARTGVYLEHFTRDSTFRRMRIGPRTRIGVAAEWAAPEWGRRPGSVGNVIEGSRFESRLAGVYLDEGTTRTTVRGSSFARQTWAAIGDFRGNDNVFHSNDYGGIAAGAQPVRTDHLSSAREG